MPTFVPDSIPTERSFADVALVVPGFCAQFARLPSRLPSLERLLAYGLDGLKRTEVDPTLEPWQHELLRALRIDDIAGHASAPLTWLGGEASAMSPKTAGRIGVEAGTWLHAQPVLLSISSLGLALQSSAPWSSTALADVERRVSEHLRASQLQWRVRNGRAYVHSETILEVHTHSVHHAVRENLRDALPTGRDALALRRLLTDLQMLLHDNPNDAEFNSLWLWGSGGMPAPAPRQLPSLWTDQDYARGVYRVHDATAHSHALPKTGEDVPLSRQPAVVVLSEIDSQELELRWLAPALRALERGTIRNAELYLDGAYARIERSWYRRLFRRPRPLFEIPT
jgi:hypothetical protein